MSFAYQHCTLLSTYSSGLGNDTSAISPNGMNASCSVSAVTWLSSPPTKTVAFSRVWSDIMRLLLCYSDRAVVVCSNAAAKSRYHVQERPSFPVDATSPSQVHRPRASVRSTLRSFGKGTTDTGDGASTTPPPQYRFPFLLQFTSSLNLLASSVHASRMPSP